MRRADIPAAVRLCRAASWNQVPRDWERLLELEPEGCFGVEADGEVVATATAVCFGRRLAWIGMVLTDPRYRRRGLARRLLERCLEYAGEREIDWIKLDATEMGRPLYQRLGFQDDEGIERWAGTAQALEQEWLRVSPYQPDSGLDRAAFGADRSRLLAKLAVEEALSIPGEGYAMGRPGASAWTLGPCVARSPEAARKLIHRLLARKAGERVFWDLLPDNREAVRLARELGFAPTRRLVRMVRPGVPGASPLAKDDQLVYATAAFEYG